MSTASAISTVFVAFAILAFPAFASPSFPREQQKHDRQLFRPIAQVCRRDSAALCDDADRRNPYACLSQRVGEIHSNECLNAVRAQFTCEKSIADAFPESCEPLLEWDTYKIRSESGKAVMCLRKAKPSEISEACRATELYKSIDQGFK